MKIIEKANNIQPNILNTTNTTGTTVLRPFVRDYPGELVPKEKLTHTHLS